MASPGLWLGSEYRPTTKHSRLDREQYITLIDIECISLPLVISLVCSVGLVMNKSKHDNEQDRTVIFVSRAEASDCCVSYGMVFCGAYGDGRCIQAADHGHWAWNSLDRRC